MFENVAAEWLEKLLCIREDSVSNLDPDTNPD